jgi:PAS domain S-box-containing protein
MIKNYKFVADEMRCMTPVDEKKPTTEADYAELQLKAQILDLGADSIIVVNGSGDIIYANEIAYKSHGYTREEFYSMNIMQIVSRLSTDVIERFYKNIDEIQPEGPVIFESINVRKNGIYLPLEVHTRVIEHNGNKYYLNIARDITDRKTAEEALADEATRRRILFEKSNDGIVILNQNGEVFEANQRFADMLGYSLEEVKQLHVWDWDIELTKEQHLKTIQRENFTEKYVETSQRRKDGSIYYVEINSNQAEVAGQNLIFSMVRDITERKQAEAEQIALLEKLQDVNAKLEQSNQALQDFAYIASHDLREPLRKVSSFGSLLQDSLAEKMDDDERENLEFMIDGAQRMQTMIDDLLTYSRLTTKAKAPEVVDLNTIVDNLKEFELAAQIDETGGIISIPHALPKVLAEESQMRQLFQNLIGNGLKYRKPDVKPVITISSVDTDNHMVQIDIQDNGIGISEEYHKQIFVMFKRLHSRSSFEGSGIGLAICKKIVNRHGGDIGVVSKPGKGSTFRFTLPLPKDK